MASSFKNGQNKQNNTSYKWVLFVALRLLLWPAQSQAAMVPFNTIIQSRPNGERMILEFCQNDECVPMGPNQGLTRKQWNHMQDYCTKLGIISQPIEQVVNILLALLGFAVSGRFGIATLAAATLLPRTNYDQIGTMAMVFPGFLSQYEFRVPATQLGQLTDGFQHCYALYARNLKTHAGKDAVKRPSQQTLHHP